MSKSRHFSLSIADFKLHVFTNVEHAVLNVDAGCKEFLIDDSVAGYDVSIKVHDFIPQELIESPVVSDFSKIITDAGYEGTCTVHKYGKLFFLMVSRPDKYFQMEPHFIAFFNEKGTRWDIYTLPINEDNGIRVLEPLCFPMLLLVMNQLAVAHNGFIINASGVFDGKTGYLFSTNVVNDSKTMAKLWKQNGAYVINDEYLLIRNINGRFYMYNLPMFFVEDAKKAVIDEVFIIKASSASYKRRLYGNTAKQRFLNSCMQMDFNPQMIDKIVVEIEELQKYLPLSELGFVPDSSVIDVIKGSAMLDWQ